MPWPTDLSAPAVDSPVMDFSVTVVIIKSAVDNFRPNISGEIHLNLFLTHIVFVKEQLLWFAMFLMQDNCSLHQHDVVDSLVHAAYRACD